MSETTQGERSQRRKLLFALIPLAAFLCLAALFYVQLGADTQRLPSALIGRPAPQFALPELPGAGLPGFTGEDLRKGSVTVVNIFASWCGPCRDEHPYLMKLAADEGLKSRGVRIAGLAYKDEPDQSLRFLKGLGNPYALIGVDRSGRAGVEWGVYGVPETFVVKGDGTIAYKFVGPISEQGLRDRLMPAIEAALL
ncbi:MAG: DsbE family thiol:disulfide interchange protein [Beijerinckiaceae bacterium]|nr:DsbE family thiol:disulfide interchange protein [Beijerinckiaceae bacterium]